jgi:hypothetical protein
MTISFTMIGYRCPRQHVGHVTIMPGGCELGTGWITQSDYLIDRRETEERMG